MRRTNILAKMPIGKNFSCRSNFLLYGIEKVFKRNRSGLWSVDFEDMSVQLESFKTENFSLRTYGLTDF